jgi:hypothetical protein
MLAVVPRVGLRPSHCHLQSNPKRTRGEAFLLSQATSKRSFPLRRFAPAKRFRIQRGMKELTPEDGVLEVGVRTAAAVGLVSPVLAAAPELPVAVLYGRVCNAGTVLVWATS